MCWPIAIGVGSARGTDAVRRRRRNRRGSGKGRVARGFEALADSIARSPDQPPEPARTAALLREWGDRGLTRSEASALFRTEGRTDIWPKFEPDTQAKIRKLFEAYLPLAGSEVLGTATLPDNFMTLDFQ